MSLSSIHNDYLDPDKHLWPEEEPEWWGDMEANCAEFMAEFSSSTGTWFDFYRPVYKYTDCGPSVGVLVHGSESPVYCDELRGVKSDAPVLQVHVSSIVEGSDAVTETYVIDMTKPGALARFWDALEAVNKEACELWEEENREEGGGK